MVKLRHKSDVCVSMSEASSYIFSSWTVAQCCPRFLSWPKSSPNYRYTNQTGWSINSERRSPLISDFKKSYIKYCALQSIISDTLASNQDVLKSGRDCSVFLCVCPRCRKYRGFIVSFSVWARRGSIRVRTNPESAHLPRKPCISTL